MVIAAKVSWIALSLQASTSRPFASSSVTTIGGRIASPISSRVKRRIIAISSTSAATVGDRESCSNMTSTPLRKPLSAVGRMTGSLDRSSIRSLRPPIRSGVPTRLMSCSAMMRDDHGVAESRKGT